MNLLIAVDLGELIGFATWVFCSYEGDAAQSASVIIQYVHLPLTVYQPHVGDHRSLWRQLSHL